jgi:hypothetical protein
MKGLRRWRAGQAGGAIDEIRWHGTRSESQSRREKRVARSSCRGPNGACVPGKRTSYSLPTEPAVQKLLARDLEIFLLWRASRGPHLLGWKRAMMVATPRKQGTHSLRRQDLPLRAYSITPAASPPSEQPGAFARLERCPS